MKLYLVTDVDQINALFKPTVPGLSHGISENFAVKYLFGGSKHVQQLYFDDDSGTSTRPKTGSNVPPHNRIKYLQHKTSHQYLAGDHTTQAGERYSKAMSLNLSANASIGADWVEMRDLWKFVQDVSFPANVETMFGTHILDQIPTLADDYLNFENGVPNLVKTFPRWLAPGAHAARRNLVIRIKEWYTSAKEYGDFTKIGNTDPEWDEYFGSKFVKARHSYLQQVSDMDEDGQACHDVGVMFALV